MKAIRLTVKNIGMVADAVVELNKPLILFYGEIRQGKTTLLNAVKWVFGGSYPSDIIRRGELEAMVRLDLDCGSITRTWYITKAGETKSRPLTFEREGKPVRDPVAEIKKFLNPFLLDQDFFRNMTELERKRYLVSIFALDVPEMDKQIADKEAEASAVRIRLKAYGDIDLTPVAEPDATELLAEKNRLVKLHGEEVARWVAEVAKRRSDHQASVAKLLLDAQEIRKHNAEVEHASREEYRLKTEIEKLQTELNATRAWLAMNTVKPEIAIPAPPDCSDLEQKIRTPLDTSKLDEEISEVKAQFVRFEQFKKNLERQKEREQDEALLMSLEATTRELRAKKLARLRSIADSSGVEGLSFDENGNFLFEDCQAGMLSTSQLMKFSARLSDLYPEGFGIDLVDRAESLGRSVFDFIERAKQENKTILAAIVGEKPAVTPPEVGVFVVENGVVKE